MLKAIRNLDYVVLLCEDVDAMTRFYNDTLGFPIYRAWEGWVEMRAGATLLTLRKRGRPYDGPSAPGSAGVQLAFRVAPGEVDACHAELLAKGANIVQEPHSYRYGDNDEYGHRTIFFKDPEGNILEIYADL
ncbi:MAG: VOC family protein [Chloroflexia bacterium]